MIRYLVDTILALQVMAGMNPSGFTANCLSPSVDANNDGKIGLEEVLYIMEGIAGCRYNSSLYSISTNIKL